MKKVFAIVLSLVLLISSSISAMAKAEEEWTCPACGATATGNFCSKCGGGRPEEGAWTCPNCGTECTGDFCSNCGTKRSDMNAQQDTQNDKIRLDLEIAFEKNAVFSTYDVKLFVDDEWVTTIRHGNDYSGSVYVTPGKHAILFEEDSSNYPAKGSTVLTVSESTLYKCEIHATVSAIEITGERTEIVTGKESPVNDDESVRIDGDLKLQVNIEFKKNAMFSQYDVDMYCDDTFVASLPHGKNYEGTLLVSKGKHMISFYKSGSREVGGTCSFTVDKDAYFSCRIESEKKKIDIQKDKLTY